MVLALYESDYGDKRIVRGTDTETLMQELNKYLSSYEYLSVRIFREKEPNEKDTEQTKKQEV